METCSECYSTHIIEADGRFNIAEFENFLTKVNLAACGLSYAVVSIMGSQSSGKSTLLNHLFGTNFKEMDRLRGRSKTTQGVWLARCAGIEPCTLVMDLEGCDGRERGEDDTTFEKQSALFALAVSHIVLINMWCSSIGLYQAGNKPLLRTIFQGILKLFSPRKTTLMFVIRDIGKTPVENLEAILREDIQKIWNSIHKPPAHEKTPLSMFFNVEVVALHSFEEREEQFKEQVYSLKQRFRNSVALGGLAGDRRDTISASEFSFSAQEIWKIIKENRDLDLPAHMVMVSTVRCDKIVKEKLESFVANKERCESEEAGQTHPASGFGKKLSSLIETCLQEYDQETKYFEEVVRSAKRKYLEGELMQHVQPAFRAMIGQIGSRTLEEFKEAFDKALNAGKDFLVAAHDCTESSMELFDDRCADAVIKQGNWDSFKDREKLRREIGVHMLKVHVDQLSKLPTQIKKPEYGFQILKFIAQLVAGPLLTAAVTCASGGTLTIPYLLMSLGQTIALGARAGGLQNSQATIGDPLLVQAINTFLRQYSEAGPLPNI